MSIEIETRSDDGWLEWLVVERYGEDISVRVETESPRRSRWTEPEMGITVPVAHVDAFIAALQAAKDDVPR